MSSVTVKFRGIPEEILDKMVECGIAETKSEAIRVAILNFGIEMGWLFGNLRGTYLPAKSSK